MPFCLFLLYLTEIDPVGAAPVLEFGEDREAAGSFVLEGEYAAMSFGEADLPSLKRAVRKSFAETECRTLPDGEDRLDLCIVERPEGKIGEFDFK